MRHIPTVYFETTMFNYYIDTDRDFHPDAVAVFEAAGRGAFTGFTSIYAVNELTAAPEPKRTSMLALIEKYNLRRIEGSPEIENLADVYISEGIVPAQKRIDALHIASASVSGLDYIVTLNFKHMNKQKTKLLVGPVNLLRGYRSITICSPMEVEYENKEHD
jgi:predicted nucleic acid-binding protein